MAGHNGTVTLHVPRDQSVRSTIVDDVAADLPPDVGERGTVEVRAVRLQDLLADEGVEAIDFLKIDVEGAEGLVVRGARGLLARDRPVVLLELHTSALEPVSGCSPAALHDQLAALGYRWHRLGPDGELEAGRPVAGPLPEAAALIPTED